MALKGGLTARPGKAKNHPDDGAGLAEREPTQPSQNPRIGPAGGVGEGGDGPGGAGVGGEGPGGDGVGGEGPGGAGVGAGDGPSVHTHRDAGQFGAGL